jgi:tRNA(Met) cytidine acetyltransferase
MEAAALIQQLLQWQKQAAQHHIRLPVIWQGELSSLLDNSAELLSKSTYQTLYWIGANAPADAVCLNQKHNYQVLGSECDLLVINAFAGLPEARRHLVITLPTFRTVATAG